MMLVHGWFPLRPLTVRTHQDMTFIYRPFGIIFSILAGLLGKKLFNYIWEKIDDEDPPKATTQETSWPKVLAAGAVQGVVFKTTRMAVDRAGAKTFYKLTG